MGEILLLISGFVCVKKSIKGVSGTPFNSTSLLFPDSLITFHP